MSRVLPSSDLGPKSGTKLIHLTPARPFKDESIIQPFKGSLCHLKPPACHTRMVLVKRLYKGGHKGTTSKRPSRQDPGPLAQAVRGDRRDLPERTAVSNPAIPRKSHMSVAGSNCYPRLPVGSAILVR